MKLYLQNGMIAEGTAEEMKALMNVKATKVEVTARPVKVVTAPVVS